MKFLQLRSAILPLTLEAAHLEIIQLRTIMLAAQKEITDYWEQHCDSEGYGPQNLVRHLGIDGGKTYYPGYLEQICTKYGLDLTEIRICLTYRLPE